MTQQARAQDFQASETVELWEAVLHRNASWNGRFVYAVTTTGVYCRPSCPARRPSPANVRYFANGNSAQYAGFRPCKRCHPDALDL